MQMLKEISWFYKHQYRYVLQIMSYIKNEKENFKHANTIVYIGCGYIYMCV